MPAGEIHFSLTLLHSEWPKLYGVFAILSAIGLITTTTIIKPGIQFLLTRQDSSPDSAFPII